MRKSSSLVKLYLKIYLFHNTEAMKEPIYFLSRDFNTVKIEPYYGTLSYGTKLPTPNFSSSLTASQL